MARDRKVDITVGAKDKASKILKQVGASIVVINQAMELGAKFARGMVEAYDFAKMGAEVEKTEFAFSQMTAAVGADANALLVEMRNLTGGTISDFDLMQKAAKATTLGVPIEKVGEFAEIARAAAAAMGESTSFMFDSIVTGTARQSKLILDNLGIIINMEQVYRDETAKLGHELSETEKKQAFMNAVIVQGQDIIRNIGDTSELASEKFAMFEATITNVKNKIAEVIGAEFADVLSDWSDELNTFVKSAEFDKMVTSLVRFVNTMAKAAPLVIAAVSRIGGHFNTLYISMNKVFHFDEMENLRNSLEETEQALIDANRVAIEFVMQGEKVPEFWTNRQEELKAKIIELEAELALVVDTATDLNTTFGEFPTITEEAAEATTAMVESGVEGMRVLSDHAKRLLKLKKKLLKEEVDAVEAAEAAKERAVEAFVNVAFASLERLSHQLIDEWGTSKLQLRDLFKGMAQDFLHFFIDKILTDMKLALVAKLMKMLIFIGPHHENDMMIVEMGRKYAGFFQQGVFEGMNMDRFAGGMIPAGLSPAGGGAVQIGAAVPAAGTTIIIQGNVIGEDEWLTERLIPAIEEKITNKETATLGIEGSIESLI